MAGSVDEVTNKKPLKRCASGALLRALYMMGIFFYWFAHFTLDSDVYYCCQNTDGDAGEYGIGKFIETEQMLKDQCSYADIYN